MKTPQRSDPTSNASALLDRDRKIALALVALYLCVLLTINLLTTNNLTWKFDLTAPRYIQPVALMLTPTVFFAAFRLYVGGRLTSFISLIILIILAVPGCLTAGFLAFLCTTSYHYFSNDIRVDVAMLGDQGALGFGPIVLTENESWGPFLYKQTSFQIDQFPTFEKDKAGKQRIQYSEEGICHNLDIDGLMAASRQPHKYPQ